jgi:signal transduction histidine kinase
VKSASASNVAIDLASTNDLFTMIVQDDGIGFDLEEAKRKGGNGLLNLEHRAEKIGAAIEFRTAPGRGTIVLLSAKIPRLRYGRVIDKFVSYITSNSHH